jgi:hypothetical protein
MGLRGTLPGFAMRSVRRVTPFAIALCVLAALGCDIADDIAHKKKLEALVARAATRPEIARELGEHYDFSEKGTPSWEELQSFLDREPPSMLVPVRENVKKYPKVMYYTTMWRMTWIFLDEKDIIRAYYLSAQ